MPSPELVLVAALDRRRAIGRQGALPWHLPDDLRRFARVTAGGTLLMGRRTAESLGRLLPDRRHLVLTRTGAVPYSGMEPYVDLPAALAAAGGAHELFVIGGEQVYAATLPLASRLLLTHVETEVEDPDAWFPPVDPATWRVVDREPHDPDARHAVRFAHVTYVPSGVPGGPHRPG